MASAQQPNIDDIADIVTATDLMRDLEISAKGLKTLDEMKAKLKECFHECQNDAGWTTKEAFSVVSEAKNEDMRKRECLNQLYFQTKTCVDKLDKAGELSMLNKNFGDVKNAIRRNHDRLKRKQYFVLVAGETSSGKSSFLNLLLGEQLLPYALLSSTSTICELKYGPERKLVVHYNGTDPQTEQPTEIVLLNPNDKSNYVDQISSYVHLKTDRDKRSPVKRVEIFWPHELLKNGITVVDSPGVGESHIMDEMVENYLANAFAFIYIINSSNAGGIQKDRIGKLFSGVKKICKERDERFPSKCALFVCNKWDTVPEGEITNVKQHVINKLKKCWPEFDPSSQIVYMSTTRAANAQAHGIITQDFKNVMERINATILTAIETRLDVHHEWLRYLLSRIVYQAKAFIHKANRGHKEDAEQRKAAITRINQIEKDQGQSVRLLRIHLDEKFKESVRKLIEHLKSNEIQRRFSTWSHEHVVCSEACMSWNSTRHEIEKSFERRFLSFIEDWEETNQVFATTIEWLNQLIVKKWNLVETQLRQLECDLIEEKSDLTVVRISKQSNYNMLGELTAGEKFWVGLCSPIWVPVTIALSVLAVPALGIMVIKGKVSDASKLKKYEENRPAFLAVASQEYLNEMASEKNMFPFVENKFQDAQHYLDCMNERLPEVIEADRKLISQLEKESRSKDEIHDFYAPILDESSAIKGKLDLFWMNEIRRMDIDDRDLEQGQRLGHGILAIVYRGKWKKREGTIDVALKVFQETLCARTVSWFLEEEATLRKLDHPHIVTFYGAALNRDEAGVHTVLVMELCQCSLRGYMRENPGKVPGKWTSTYLANLKRTVGWTVGIFEALDYMHKLGIVHRDLKLDNILVTESEVVKIADVGFAKKAEDITGTLAGSWLYIAPEVWASIVYGSAADIYSLGIMMWEMWYGKIAFFDNECCELDTSDLEKKVKEGLRPLHVGNFRKPPQRWLDVMVNCWAENPKKRPNAASCQKELKSLLNDCG